MKTKLLYPQHRTIVMDKPEHRRFKKLVYLKDWDWISVGEAVKIINFILRYFKKLPFAEKVQLLAYRESLIKTGDIE